MCFNGGGPEYILGAMKTFKLVAVLLVLLVLAGLGFFLFGHFSDGYRAGTVIKLSRKGYVFKTYEGQLNLGMVLGDPGTAQSEGFTNPMTSNIWHFSVPGSEKEVIRILEESLLTGKRVKLHYVEKFVKMPWRGDTKYLITEVQSL